jgi:two-component system, OmpR family, sensor kinase
VTLTLRSRLTLIYTAVFGFLLVAISVVSYRVLAYQLDADVSANLAELTTGLHGYLKFDQDAPAVVFDHSDAAEAAFVDEATRYYQVFDAATGDLLVQSDAIRPLGLEFGPGEVQQFGDQRLTMDVVTDYGRLRISNSVLTPANGRRYLLQVGVSLASMDRALERFLFLLLTVVPAGLAVTFLVGRWMARFALTPLTRLVDSTHAISIEDLGRRVPVRRAHDELDDVATAFNDVLERLEHAIGEMRQFSTALAHELRTPLAALRGDIEMAMLRQHGTDPQQRAASQLEEIDRLKRLIDQILVLARAEAGEIPLTMGHVDLGTLVTSLVEQIEPVAQARGIAMQCEHVDSVFVRGDAEWLKRVVLNLLDNAIKFTPQGGRVVIGVTRHGDAVRLEVRDTGIGIDSASRPRVFERFFRADPARSRDVEGVGLGLSLSKWIVDRHHGRIDVDSQPGEGSTFTVTLPVCPQQP